MRPSAGPPAAATPLPVSTIAAARAAAPELRILDVGEPAEFASGHPAGAGRLTPAEFGPQRMELPAREAPVLVVHEDPDHSRAAALQLASRGFERVQWLAVPLDREPEGRSSIEPAARLWSPSPFVERAVRHRPPRRALDLACGSGRAAVFLALAGWRAEGWDVDPSALDRARAFAARQQANVQFREVDLEGAPPALPDPPFDLIVVVRYLHRPLFPWIERALAPGGVLAYETFRDGQQRFGPPRREQHLLRAGELLTAFPALAVELHEDSPGGKPPLLSRLVARRPG